MSEYVEFLKAKGLSRQSGGFKPLFMPDFLFPFQSQLVDWAVRLGRAALFEDCGLGKTPQQLVWAENVIRKMGKKARVLILAPLAVGKQTVREAKKFGLTATHVRGGELAAGINVTNYEQLSRFQSKDFNGLVCDESGILKSVAGKYRKQAITFANQVPYCLLCTATPSPNDFMELGGSAEALGVMTRNQMLAMFFTNDGDTTQQWRLKGHAKQRFWQWVATWARAVRKPSDLGFEDGKFKLPPLNVQTYTVPSAMQQRGLFPPQAKTLDDQRAEAKRTLVARCKKLSSLLPKNKTALVWCHLNAEGDLLEKLIPNAIQVSGSDPDEFKEEAVEWFIGQKCICNSALFRSKLATWQKDQKNTGSNTIKSIGKSDLPDPSNTNDGIQRSERSTCKNTTRKTRRNGRDINKRTECSEINTAGICTLPIQNIGSDAKHLLAVDAPKRKGNQDSAKNTESVVKPTKECSASKTESVQSAVRTKRIAEDTSCTSITATKQARSEDCSVPVAIKGSASSKTTQNSSRKHSCICGHLSGIRVLISKPRIFGYGLNLQCCSEVGYFPSHSHEMFYQAIRRSWRFGQDKPVNVYLVNSESCSAISETMIRKERQSIELFDGVVREMHSVLTEKKNTNGHLEMELPTWLKK